MADGAEAVQETRTSLAEPHILPPAEDHPHWLVIYRVQPNCTKGLKGDGRTFSRFWARCKLCGGEDRWGTINPELSAIGRSQFGGAPYTADQDAEIYLATVNSNDLRGGARAQMERKLQTTAVTEEGDDD